MRRSHSLKRIQRQMRGVGELDISGGGDFTAKLWYREPERLLGGARDVGKTLSRKTCKEVESITE